MSGMLKKAVVTLRKSTERGHANFGWLDSKYTFSFEKYYDSEFKGFGSLRVINEDRVKPRTGFGMHSHNNFEIFSYIVSGELEHKDSMGNVETIKRHGVQFTSAGTGMSHSEHNNHPTDEVHFIQIWIRPDEKGLTPYYSTMEFTEEQKKNQLCLIVGPAKKQHNAIKVNQDAYTYASILEKDTGSVNYTVKKDRKAYIHLIQTSPQASLSLQATYNCGASSEVSVLNEGDGAFIEPQNDDVELVINGNSKDLNSEFLFFDVAK